MSGIWWAVIGLAIGGLTGAAMAWVLGGRAGQGKAVVALKKENEQFREEVTDHFVKTAALINNLTDSYKEVFDHLSQGADRLVDRKSLAERMPRVSNREVRLKHIGAPRDGSESAGGSGAGQARGRHGSAQPASPAKQGATRSPLTARRPK